MYLRSAFRSSIALNPMRLAPSNATQRLIGTIPMSANAMRGSVLKRKAKVKQNMKTARAPVKVAEVALMMSCMSTWRTLVMADRSAVSMNSWGRRMTCLVTA